MRARLIAILVGVVGLTCQDALAGPQILTQAWVDPIAGGGSGSTRRFGRAIATSPDGERVYSMIGVSATERAFTEVRAYAASGGRVLWTSPDLDGYGEGVAISLSQEGDRLYVSSWRMTEQGAAMTVTAWRARDGEILWRTKARDPSNLIDNPMGVAVSPDGSRVFVAGTRFLGPKRSRPVLVARAYRARDGSEMWTSTYDAPEGRDIASTMALSPRGHRLFLTGVTRRSITDRDFITIALRSRTGTLVWASTYDGLGGADVPTAITASPTGVVIVAGTSMRGYDQTTAVVAYRIADGERSWEHVVDPLDSSHDAPAAMTLTSDGERLFVTGYGRGLATGHVGRLVAWPLGSAHGLMTRSFDVRSGELLWTSLFVPARSGASQSRDIEITSDDSTLLIGGEVWRLYGTRGDYDLIVGALDAATGTVWSSAEYDGARDDEHLGGLAVGAAGSRVFVSGSSSLPDTGDGAVTIGYSTRSLGL